MVTGACVGTTGPMSIPLRWAPTKEHHIPAASADALRQQAIRVDRFEDVRSDRTIGKNTETRINDQQKGDWLVSTTDDVGPFLSARFKDVLATSAIVAVEADATRVIKAQVQRFFVTEGSSYKADVVVHFVVEDGAGRTLWQGVAEGHADQWGRSYHAENYQESLSNAFLEATDALFGNAEFLQAFRGESSASATGSSGG
jgi:hypothetical protein